MSTGQFLTPAEARQDATDRLTGLRTRLALRIVAVITAVLFAAMGITTDPRVGNVESDILRLLAFVGFALLGLPG